jgi:hypothetical protein
MFQEPATSSAWGPSLERLLHRVHQRARLDAHEAAGGTPVLVAEDLDVHVAELPLKDVATYRPLGERRRELEALRVQEVVDDLVRRVGDESEEG